MYIFSLVISVFLILAPHAFTQDIHDDCKCDNGFVEQNMQYSCSYVTDRVMLSCSQDIQKSGPNNWSLSCDILCKLVEKPTTKDAKCIFRKGVDIGTGETGVMCSNCRNSSNNNDVIGGTILTLSSGMSNKECMLYLKNSNMIDMCNALSEKSTFCTQYKSKAVQGNLCCPDILDDVQDF